MRLSEKTLELNFASQMNHHFGGKLIWFGLTQKQEAKAGFDIATRMGKGLFIFQMKASKEILASGARQFRAPHNQLKNLIGVRLSLVGLPIPHRSVFYAFPTIGTTAELTVTPNVFANTWLCDVMQLGALGPPFRKEPASYVGPPALRKDGNHYVDVMPGNASSATTGTATFHSDPIVVSIRTGALTFENILQGGLAEPMQEKFGLLQCLDHQGFEDFWRICELFERKAFGIVITP